MFPKVSTERVVERFLAPKQEAEAARLYVEEAAVAALQGRAYRKALPPASPAALTALLRVQRETQDRVEILRRVVSGLSMSLSSFQNMYAQQVQDKLLPRYLLRTQHEIENYKDGISKTSLELQEMEIRLRVVNELLHTLERS